MEACLIERNGFGIGFCDGKFKWTTFDGSLKFADKESAEKIKRYIRKTFTTNDNIEITEHLWVDSDNA